MTIITRRSILMGAILLGACVPPAENQTEIAAIETLMRATWERPDAPLGAGPIVVDGDYAVADWTQGAMGGRALLRKRDGQWRVVLCAGDAIRGTDGLRAVGVPDPTASRLATSLRSAEGGVDSARLAQMSAFTDIVRMDGVSPEPVHP